jgi:hypothetical protein
MKGEFTAESNKIFLQVVTFQQVREPLLAFCDALMPLLKLHWPWKFTSNYVGSFLFEVKRSQGHVRHCQIKMVSRVKITPQFPERGKYALTPLPLLFLPLEYQNELLNQTVPQKKLHVVSTPVTYFIPCVQTSTVSANWPHLVRITKAWYNISSRTVLSFNPSGLHKTTLYLHLESQMYWSGHFASSSLVFQLSTLSAEESR